MNPTSGIERKTDKESISFVALDGLRGISAIVVCVAHSYYGLLDPMMGRRNALERSLNCGMYLSVLIFFVLSGFMITLSILRNAQNYHGAFSLRAYLAARLARIYPPLLFALAIEILVFGMIHGLRLCGSESFRLPGDQSVLREQAILTLQQLALPVFQLQHLFLNEFMVMNGSLWSLPYEFWIYILVGFFSVWMVNRRLLGGLLPFIGLLAIVAAWNHYFILYFGIWLSGCFWAIAWRRGWHKSGVFDGWIYGVVALSLSGMVVVVSEVGLSRAVQGEKMFRLLFNGLLCVLLSAVGFLSRRYWQRWLRLARKWATALANTADFSYTLYLVHFPIVLLSMATLRPLVHDKSRWIPVLAWLVTATVAILFARWVAPWVENRNWCLPRLKRMLHVPPTQHRETQISPP